MAPGALEGKSVALQSLSTYERVLTNNAARLAQGKGTDTDRYACTLMTAIARFQSGTADALETEWSSPGGYRDHIRAADAKTAAQDYFRAFVGTLDAIIQQKLERPMGESAADARPKRAESWRTGRSLDNIEANLETLRAMFAVKDGFADLLRAAGQGPLADTMIQSFDRTLGRIRAIPKPLSVALTDPDLRPKIEDILVEVKALRKLSTGPVAEGIGLIVGFNALDGD